MSQVIEEMRFGTDEAPKARDAVVMQVSSNHLILWLQNLETQYYYTGISYGYIQSVVFVDAAFTVYLAV